MSEGKEVRWGSDSKSRDRAEAGSVRRYDRNRDNRRAASLQKGGNVAGADTMALLPVAVMIHPLVMALMTRRFRGMGGLGSRTGVRQLEPGA